MPQERTTAEVRAGASSEETRQFVRRVRRVTRRKFSPEEKVRIVLQGFRGEVRVSDLCRRRQDRVEGLGDRPSGPGAPWNKLRPEEEQAVLALARASPELSPGS